MDAAGATGNRALAYREAHVGAVIAQRNRALKLAARQKEILDDDQYVDALEFIIRRDFFPDIARLDAQAALLDALEAGDTAAARTAYDKLVPSATAPAAAARRRRGGVAASVASGWEAASDVWEAPTPAGFGHGPDGGDTPAPTDVAGAAPPDARGPRAGLDAFLATHMSEDNASFSVVLAKDQAERKRKLWWMQDVEGQPVKMHACLHGPERVAALMPPAADAPSSEPPKPLATLLQTLADPAASVAASLGLRAAHAESTELVVRTADGALVAAPPVRPTSGGVMIPAASTAVTVTGSAGGGGAASGPLLQYGASAAAGEERPWHKQGAIARDERPACFDAHPFVHENALMFPPKPPPTQAEFDPEIGRAHV